MIRDEGQIPSFGRDGVFLWQRGGNTGDDLIRRGCLAFLRSQGLDVVESDGSIEKAAAKGDRAYLRASLKDYPGFVFFTGGGNIGIYRDNERLRASVLRHARSARGVLVFPQSVARVETALRDERVTVWSRDAVSRKKLSAAGVRTDLVPDAAFAVDAEIPKMPGGAGVFLILRDVGTCNERVDHPIAVSGPSADLTYDRSIEEIQEALRDFRTVVSDRLHGGIVSLMMRKRTAWLPVRYNKIESFYRTWFESEPGIGFVRTQEDVTRFVERDDEPTLDLAERFHEAAVPALRHFLDRSTRTKPKVTTSGVFDKLQRGFDLRAVRLRAAVRRLGPR